MLKFTWLIFALLLTTAFANQQVDNEDATVEEEAQDVNVPGFDGGKMPSPDQLLKMLDSMDLSEEEKDNIRASLLQNAESVDHLAGARTSGGFLYQTLILLSLLSLLALIFGAIGYKLYKGLVEREIKREMKRKQKELKKKK